jgi:hypothetical protein
MTRKSARSADQTTPSRPARIQRGSARHATTAEPPGRSKKKRKSTSLPASEHRVDALIAATAPLLEFFAVADDVFTEDDAMDPAKRQMAMGRLYRGWKAAREQLDPGWKDRRR